jgi:hypothetical protein
MKKKISKAFCSWFGHKFTIRFTSEEMWAECTCCGQQVDIPGEREAEAYRQINLGIWKWKE